MFEIDKFEVTAVKETFRSAVFYICLTVVFGWSFAEYGMSMQFAGAVIFGLFLLLFTIIDLKHFILPDILILPALLLGLISPIFTNNSWINVFMGAFLGFALFFAIAWLFFKVRGYHGLGFGDVKFLAVLGAWCGASGIAPIILISSFVAIFAFALRKIVKNVDTSSPLPFGPFLALGGWFIFLYEMPIWHIILSVRESIIKGIVG